MHIETANPPVIPYQELEIPSAHTPEEVSILLAEVISGHLPGFVLRQAGVIYGGTGAGAMNEVEGIVRNNHVPADHELTKGYDMSYSDDPSDDHTNSDWHIDRPPSYDPDDPSYGLHLLHIEEGSADLGLALTGSAVGKDTRNASDSLKAQIKLGKTDPELMEPVVYRGKIEPNDIAVFPTHGNKPAWHSVITRAEDGVRQTNLRSLSVNPQTRLPEVESDDDGD